MSRRAVLVLHDTRWMVFVLSATAVLAYVDRQVINLLADAIKSELEVSTFQISLLQGAAFAIIYSIAGLPLGRAADVWPRRRIIFLGILIWSAATLACGLAQSFGWLFVSRIAVGIGEAALIPAAISMIADSTLPRHRGLATAVFILGMSVGNGASIWIGGALFESAQHGYVSGFASRHGVTPWRFPFIVLGAFGFLFSLVVLTVKEPDRAQETQADAPLKLMAALGQLWQLRAVIVPHVTATALTAAAGFAVVSWVPTMLGRNFGLRPGEIGSALGPIFIVGGIAGNILAAFLVDAVGKRGGVRARLALLIPLATLVGLSSLCGAASSIFWVLTLAGTCALVSGVISTAAMTAMQEILPPRMRGLGASLLSFGNIAFGLAVGTAAVALIVDRLLLDPRSIGTAITLVGVSTSAAASILFWQAQRAAGRMAADRSQGIHKRPQHAT